MPTRRQFLASAAALCAPRSATAQILGQVSWPQQDALWVWGEPIFAPDNALSDFAARRGIAVLFVYVSPAAAEALLSGRHDAVASVRALAAKDSRLYAVAGEPEWAGGVTEIPTHAALLIRLAQTTRFFDGLHFDVEPNALPEWRDPIERPRLAGHMLRFYEMIRAAAPDADIDAAANPIYADLTIGDASFMRQLAERINSVSLMAYRNNVARAVDWARPAVRDFIAAKRRWRMGVLAGDGEPGTSWKNASPSVFNSAMATLRERLVKDFPASLCAGLAFQDYESLAGIFAGSAPPFK